MVKWKMLWSGADKQAPFGYSYRDRLAGNTRPDVEGMKKIIRSGKVGF